MIKRYNIRKEKEMTGEESRQDKWKRNSIISLSLSNEKTFVENRKLILLDMLGNNFLLSRELPKTQPEQEKFIIENILKAGLDSVSDKNKKKVEDVVNQLLKREITPYQAIGIIKDNVSPDTKTFRSRAMDKALTSLQIALAPETPTSTFIDPKLLDNAMEYEKTFTDNTTTKTVTSITKQLKTAPTKGYIETRPDLNSNTVNWYEVIASISRQRTPGAGKFAANLLASSPTEIRKKQATLGILWPEESRAEEGNRVLHQSILDQLPKNALTFNGKFQKKVNRILHLAPFTTEEARASQIAKVLDPKTTVPTTLSEEDKKRQERNLSRIKDILTSSRIPKNKLTQTWASLKEISVIYNSSLEEADTATVNLIEEHIKKTAANTSIYNITPRRGPRDISMPVLQLFYGERYKTIPEKLSLGEVYKLVSVKMGKTLPKALLLKCIEEESKLIGITPPTRPERKSQGFIRECLSLLNKEERETLLTAAKQPGSTLTNAACIRQELAHDLQIRDPETIGLTGLSFLKNTDPTTRDIEPRDTLHAPQEREKGRKPLDGEKKKHYNITRTKACPWMELLQKSKPEENLVIKIDDVKTPREKATLRYGIVISLLQEKKDESRKPKGTRSPIKREIPVENSKALNILEGIELRRYNHTKEIAKTATKEELLEASKLLPFGRDIFQEAAKQGLLATILPYADKKKAPFVTDTQGNLAAHLAAQTNRLHKLPPSWRTEKILSIENKKGKTPLDVLRGYLEARLKKPKVSPKTLRTNPLHIIEIAKQSQIVKKYFIKYKDTITEEAKKVAAKEEATRIKETATVAPMGF